MKVTFARWCISGLVTDCACRRCLEGRGEVSTPETEAAAQARSEMETEKFYRRTREWLEQIAENTDEA